MLVKMIFLIFLIVNSLGCVASKQEAKPDPINSQEYHIQIALGCLISAKNIINNYNFKADLKTRKELLNYCEYIAKNRNYIIEGMD